MSSLDPTPPHAATGPGAHRDAGAAREKPRGRAPLNLGALFLLGVLVLGYATLHATTLDEAWSRPVSRALQAAIAFTAALSLALRARGVRVPRWIAAVGYGLLALGALSVLVEHGTWIPISVAAGVPWAVAMAVAGAQTRGRGGDSRAPD